MEGGERNIPSERRGCLKKTGEGERGGKGIGGSQAERGKGFVLEKRASTVTGSPGSTHWLQVPEEESPFGIGYHMRLWLCLNSVCYLRPGTLARNCAAGAWAQGCLF